MPTTLGGGSCCGHGVKSTTSAKRMEAELKESAIVSGSAFSLLGDRARQHVEQQVLRHVLARPAAAARRRASRMKTTAPPTTTFSASMVVLNHVGSRTGRRSARPGSRRPGRRPRTATNQRMLGADVPKTSAPIGPRMPHRPTAPEARKPAVGPHRQRGRQGDVQQLDAQQQLEVPRAREQADGCHRDHEVREGHQARHRAQREVQASPTPARSAG